MCSNCELFYSKRSETDAKFCFENSYGLNSQVQWELEYRTSPDFEDGRLERTGHLDTEQLENWTFTTGLH